MILGHGNRCYIVGTYLIPEIRQGASVSARRPQKLVFPPKCFSCAESERLAGRGIIQLKIVYRPGTCRGKRLGGAVPLERHRRTLGALPRQREYPVSLDAGFGLRAIPPPRPQP